MVKNYNELLYDNETMQCEHIILRKFQKYDADAVFELGSDHNALKYIFWDGVKSHEEALSTIINIYWSMRSFYAIAQKDNNKCIGYIGIKLDINNDKASFYFMVSRKYWGKGIATEALSTILRLCFDKLQVNKVEADHCEENVGSGKVMQKCGMSFEGKVIDEVIIKNSYRTLIHYGITKIMWQKMY